MTVIDAAWPQQAATLLANAFAVAWLVVMAATCVRFVVVQRQRGRL
jgi:hypothetical protein